MANGFLPLLRYLHRVAAGTSGGDLNDAQLLERFVRQQDEAAFAVLFQRHARMVWNVCFRVLREPHQAEDAFQATFLVLVRKAGSIVPREQLPNWLYGVAVRTAKKAKVQAIKRLGHQKEVNMSGHVSAEAPGWNDLAALLDEEVRRLPAKYRAPLVLCYLEGMSNEEVARQLGCPESTLRSWLTRAREMLRQRLQRRGMVLPAATLTTLLAENAASAALPSGLADSTLTLTHTLLATGQLGAAPASVAALTQGVLKDMMLIKVKIAAGVFAATMVLAGSGLAMKQAMADKPAEPAAQTQEERLTAGAPASTEGALAPVSPEEFARLHDLAKPQDGESKYMDAIPWVGTLWEARQKAAVEGKPLLLIASRYHPLGGC